MFRLWIAFSLAMPAVSFAKSPQADVDFLMPQLVSACEVIRVNAQADLRMKTPVKLRCWDEGQIPADEQITLSEDFDMRCLKQLVSQVEPQLATDQKVLDLSINQLALVHLYETLYEPMYEQYCEFDRQTY